jgi:phage terminase large subunit-like protein
LHIEQLKKLSEQIDRKEEKIAQLLSENSALNQSMQTMQLQTERCKIKMNGIEKDNL